MKIKTTKQMNLHELIKHVWENGITDTRYRTHDAPYWELAEVNKTGVVSVSNVSQMSRFTVEVEEELTEETHLGQIWGLVLEDARPVTMETLVYDSETIKGVLEEDRKNGDVVLQSLYVINGGYLTLIWSKEHGIPTEGVIGCS